MKICIHNIIIEDPTEKAYGFYINCQYHVRFNMFGKSLSDLLWVPSRFVYHLIRSGDFQ